MKIHNTQYKKVKFVIIIVTVIIIKGKSFIVIVNIQIVPCAQEHPKMLISANPSRASNTNVKDFARVVELA